MTGDSKYTLREATANELELARRGHAAAWAAGLTVEQYLSREHHLASQDLTRSGGIKFWILIDATNPSRALCSCESIIKPAVVRFKNGEVKQVKSHVIGGVFTPEKNRGKGYASVMLDKLAEVLDGECSFDALYSDIGKAFYAKKGWKPYPSTHISLPPSDGPKPAVEPSSVKLLEACDLEQLCEQDCKSILDSFRTTHLPTSIDIRLAYLPTHAVIKWHHAREEFVGKHLTSKSPTIKGAISPSGKRWCIWTRAFNSLKRTEQKLTILRLVDLGSGDDCQEAKEELVNLLKAAQDQAGIWGMKEVVIWSPSDKVVSAAGKVLGDEGKVQVVEREMDSIASLRWSGEGGAEARIWWDLNEKFGWC